MNTTKTRVAIIGGGVAGIAAANELSKSGTFDVSIFEKSDRLGGLNQSVLIDELYYDIGTFVYNDFHSLLESFPFLKEIYTPITYNPININTDGHVDKHPISLKGYWKNFGTLNLIHSLFSLVWAKLKFRNYSTLPGYCKYHLGEVLYEKSGLQQYIKRLYKSDDNKIDIKLGYSRIKSLSNYSIRKVLSRLSSIRNDFFFKPHLEDNYVRPKEGFQRVFAILEEHLGSIGISISKNANITQIVQNHKGFNIECNAEWQSFDRVISTIPFTITQKLIGQENRFRPGYMKLLTLFYKGQVNLDSCTIYNYTADGEWKRITVYSKYYGKADGLDYFSVEITIPSDDDKTLDYYKADFEKLAEKYDLVSQLSYQGHKEIPFAYPVFIKDETAIAERELDRIRDFGIDLIGRQGTFEYLSSDETIRSTKAYINEQFEVG